MPRRYIDYADAFAGWNAVSSYGSYLSIAATVFFLVMPVYALVAGRKAEANPWGEGATTLKWPDSSPPPFHPFNDLPPIRGGTTGRASCGERVCQYVWIWVVARSLKNKQKNLSKQYT